MQLYHIINRTSLTLDGIVLMNKKLYRQNCKRLNNNEKFIPAIAIINNQIIFNYNI